MNRLASPRVHRGRRGRPLSLLISDQPELCKAASATLREAGFELSVVGSVVDALHEFPLLRPDIILADCDTPQFQPGPLCQLLRESQPTPYTYVILLARRAALPHLADVLRIGADESLEKPFEPEALVARVEAAGRLLRADRAEELATSVDAATGALREPAFRQLLQSHAAQCRVAEQSWAVVHLTIDNMAEIRKRHGRRVGDAALRHTGEALRGMLEWTDEICRTDESDFLLTLPGTDAVNALECGRRIVSRMQNLAVMSDVDVQVSLSLGIAVAGPQGSDPATMLSAAAEAVSAARMAPAGDRIVIRDLPLL